MPDNTIDTQKVYTVEDWLFGCVNFSVPQSAVDYICVERGVDPQQSYEDAKAGELDLRLLKADLYKWIVLGAGKVNNTSDSDNGWSHSEGGYNMNKDDKKLLMAEANAIYDELEPDSVFGKRYTRVHSLGIMPAKRDVDGEPLPRIVR
jgi:hypothetical protein